MLRRALTLALLLLPASAMADAPQLVEPGKLIWGTSPTFTPFEFMQDGKAAGFDVDLMDELGKRIKLTSTMMGMDFKGIIPAILGHRIDAGVSGIYVTPARTEVADFIPYILVGDQIVVQKGNPKHLGAPATLCGSKLAVAVSTAFEASAKQASTDCTAQGKAAIDLLSLPGTNMAALALSQGRVDAILISTATAAAMMGETPGAYELAGDPFNADTKIGIALSKTDPVLKGQLDQAMKAMVADGTYAGLLKKWNLPMKASPF